MTEDTQPVSQPRRVDSHAGAAANPEQHLTEAHNLSIRVQGKEGTWGRAIWALIREEKGKVKTLAVFEGTQREAAHHFFNFIHPDLAAAAAAAPASRSYSRPPFRSSRPQGRPQGRP